MKTKSSATAEILRKADDSLEAIGQLLDDLNNKIASAENELTAIPHTLQEQASLLEIRRTNVARLEVEHNQAVSYAKLARGTAHEQSSIQATATARRQLSTAQQELAKAEQVFTEQSEQASTREHELQSQAERLREEYNTALEQYNTTLATREQVRQEQSQLAYTAIMDQVNAHQREIDTLQEQLLASQVAYHETLQQALADPALSYKQREMISSLTPAQEDSTYRVLNAALFYLETIRRENKPVRVLFAEASPEVTRLAFDWLPVWQWFDIRPVAASKVMEDSHEHLAQALALHRLKLKSKA